MSVTSETKTNLSHLSLREIDTFLTTQKKSHFYRRILFLKYRKQKKTYGEITSLLHVCKKTLTNWMNLFRKGGMQALVEISYNRRNSKLCDVEKEIQKKVQTGEIETVSACKKWLEEVHGKQTSISNLGWFLKKNGLILQKNETCSGKDPQ